MNYKRRKPRTQVRCALCTPRAFTSETVAMRAREAAKANADLDEAQQCGFPVDDHDASSHDRRAREGE